MNIKELVDKLVAFGVPNNKLNILDVDNLKWLMANLGKIEVGGQSNAVRPDFDWIMEDLMARYKNLVNKSNKGKK